MVNLLLYQAWLLKERARKRWAKMPRGRRWGITWLTGIALFLLVTLPWQAIGIITVIVAFVAFIIITVWALFAVLDP